MFQRLPGSRLASYDEWLISCCNSNISAWGECEVLVYRAAKIVVLERDFRDATPVAPDTVPLTHGRRLRRIAYLESTRAPTGSAPWIKERAWGVGRYGTAWVDGPFEGYDDTARQLQKYPHV